MNQGGKENMYQQRKAAVNHSQESQYNTQRMRNKTAEVDCYPQQRNSTNILSDFNNRLNAEASGIPYFEGGQGKKKARQYNNRVYKPTPKDTKPVAKKDPYVIRLNNKDHEICRQHSHRMYTMQHSTLQSIELQMHLNMIADGTNYLLAEQQRNLMNFYDELRHKEMFASRQL